MAPTAKFLLLAAAAALVVGAPAHAQAPDLLIKAKRIVLAPDAAIDGGSLLVRQGKVAYVGDEIPAEAKARAKVLDFGDATVAPGFVLAYATLGQDGNLAEAAFPFTPDLQVAEGVDLWHDEIARLPHSGVTAAAIAPSERQLAGGIAALVKPGKDAGTLASSDLQLGMSLTRNARSQDRPPTSLMGALDMARTAFRDAKTGVRTGSDMAVLRQALDGSRRVFCRADARREILAALDLAQEFGLQVVIVGGAEAGETVERLAAQKAGIVLGTLSPESKLEQLELPAALAKAGVPFAFSGQPEQLRLSAALAVKHGLDRRGALAALTRTPATLLGLQAEVGSLRQGAAADFAVFSGDPIDLTSRHLSTWIGGERRSGDAAAGGL
ncbi:MAG: hypothetical protein RL398_711 [Planctomycetota bacterium]|jgi:imidazolonepropionase-like amidohydrolase